MPCRPSASLRSPRSRPARTTRSPSATPWSDSSSSRPPAREPIRAGSVATTRSSGRNSNRCPTCSTPTATSSAFSSGQLEGNVVSLDGRYRNIGLKPSSSARIACACSTTSSAGSLSRRSNAKELAKVAARLCRLLRDEVTEQLDLGSPALTALATDWRKLLFPEANDAQFADGYAQAVTFGLLMARARDIQLSTGLDQVAKKLGQTNSLIGAALRLLTDDADNQETLKTSLGTLTRVLDAVNWHDDQQGQSRRVALLLRGFSGGLRQRLAEADRLVLHPARSRRRDGPARR